MGFSFIVLIFVSRFELYFILIFRKFSVSLFFIINKLRIYINFVILTDIYMNSM